MNNNSMSAGMRAAMLYGMPGMIFVVNTWLPAALQLHFVITTALGAVQGALFRNHNFRKTLGIAPLPSAAAPKENTINVSATVRAFEQLKKDEAAAVSRMSEARKSRVEKGVATLGNWVKKLPGVEGAYEEALKKASSGPDNVYKNKAKQYEKRRAREIAEQKEEDRQLREWQARTRNGGR